eukprot:TRINITY_DN38244_c0_g1_i1.p1 TRINITY_DN38244_c0_g1~~TRINITY_DN38244_c0_g1_i1.p1  ORF type:complete len:267 (+),score=100.77 TRINITY_DN38244_c0_g1_i1:68-868(+)
MAFMSSMGPGADLARAFEAEHARLTHDQKVETFRPDDVKNAETVDREAQETMGTTILAAAFDGGVVLASDTVTSSYIVADYAAPKITRLTDHIWMLRSGNAADTRTVAKVCQKYLRNLEIQMGREVPVRAAARLVQQILFYNRGNLSAGLIVGGWDQESGGQVFNILSDGAKSKLDLAMGGSGSIFVYGLADSTFQKGMTEAQCKEWMKKIVAHAKARDGSSGMNTRLTTINKDGAVQSFFAWEESPYRMETDKNWENIQEQVIPK